MKVSLNKHKGVYKIYMDIRKIRNLKNITDPPTVDPAEIAYEEYQAKIAAYTRMQLDSTISYEEIVEKKQQALHDYMEKINIAKNNKT